MTLEIINQNAESLYELSAKYDSMLEQRNNIANSIKTLKDKKELKKKNQELEQIELQLNSLKEYILKILIQIQKLINETQKNA